MISQGDEKIAFLYVFGHKKNISVDKPTFQI